MHENLENFIKTEIFQFCMCHLCAWNVPAVRTIAHTIWCLKIENKYLCGSDAVSHVFLRQELASVAQL